VEPVTVSTTIARPREDVFDYLADIANHPEFTDHFMVDWHLLREDTQGKGAGARFRVRAPLSRFDWGDATFVEVEPPYRIVEAGRTGKFNRIRTLGEYRLTEVAGNMTRVEFSLETQPALLSDRIMESLGGRGWLRRKLRRAMRRLRAILEDGEQRGRRATIAGR
jgi:uncharacterized protein YndB with AHSA1/START domain